ncbi:hypothetical protein [Desulfuribacillus alkaliarsenatis]|uniref:Uncharacterized protein n=1 Tax=Desulfuribacillus alkaliarsenatis TaxID=766136 RepID=A0A1E5FZD9_9FIRM|nr:hypothetical protein [Desulfuribacillus alkaliarsenatis]OEF95935.1 hypothetical protein BHF68_11130 [Desulfuribacillus alkaliarsenatis]
MNRIKWSMGLFNTLFIHFFVGLAVAMLMVKWTWLDMRTNAGAIIPALLMISGFVYLINTKVRIYQTLYWQRPLAIILVAASGVVIALTNSFNSLHMQIVPASTVRAGFFLKNITLNQINVWVGIVFLIGIVSYVIYHKLQTSIDNDDTRSTLKGTKRIIILTVMYTVFIILIMYMVQPGIRYFINSLIGI